MFKFRLGRRAISPAVAKLLDVAPTQTTEGNAKKSTGAGELNSETALVERLRTEADARRSVGLPPTRGYRV